MIYVASKTRHAPMWRRLRGANYPINSTWIDEAGTGETKDFADLWIRCVREASECKVLVLHAEGADVLKGAYVEVGAALAASRRVLSHGLPVTLSFLNHPLVTRCTSLDEAMRLAEQIAREQS